MREPRGAGHQFSTIVLHGRVAVLIQDAFITSVCAFYVFFDILFKAFTYVEFPVGDPHILMLWNGKGIL